MTAVDFSTGRTGDVSVTTSMVVPAMGVGLLGAGLVTTAVGAGMQPMALVLMVGAGAAQLAAALALLAGRADRRPLAVTAASLAPAILVVGLLVVDPAGAASMAVVPMLVGLALAVPAACAPRFDLERRPRPGLAVAGIVASAVVVGFVATSALSGTVAGGFAAPHGEHSTVDDHGGH